MRLQQYITESVITVDDIKTNCSEWLKESGGHVVYRGMKQLSSDVEVITPRTDRRPRDSSEALHEGLDSLMFKKFGWHPRKEGVFVTGDRAVATQYGTSVYAVFPFNGYKYVWSKTAVDMYTEFGGNTFARELDAFVGMFMKDEGEYHMSKQLQRAVDSYIDTDLKKAINEIHEISIKCSKYYAVAIKSETFRQLRGR